MASKPGESDKDDKGFWDGGATGHASNKESSGRSSGFPGARKPGRVGVRTDLDFPPAKEKDETKP